MNCCVCNGSCCHVGPHSYCAAHGGGPTLPIYTSTNSAPLAWPPTQKQTCNHCFCLRHSYMPDHARCCKCDDTMHDQFVASRVGEVITHAPE